MKKYLLPFSSLFWIVGFVMISYFSSWIQSSFKGTITPSRNQGQFASRVVESSAGAFDAEKALGPTSFPRCENCAMRIFRGEVVFEFSKAIVDGFGNDLRVYEVDGLYDLEKKPRAREYKVLGSDNRRDFKFLGYGLGVTDFDIRRTGLKEIRYIKIIPAIGYTNYKPDLKNHVKIDALESLN